MLLLMTVINFFFGGSMTNIIPKKLKKGDHVRIIAPSRGAKIIGHDVRKIAEERFKKLGLSVSYGRYTTDDNWDLLGTSPVNDRLFDLKDAFHDPEVDAIFTIIGGFNSNQLLPFINYELIARCPKILCGFSDITVLLNAIYAKSRLVTFLGPHFSSIGMLKGCDYTIDNMVKMLMEDGQTTLEPSQEWSDDAWFIDQENRNFIKNDGYWWLLEGEGEGTLLGGNLGSFNLLLGTPFCPEFDRDTILMIEDTAASDITDFMRNLTALIYQKGFGNVRGLLIGRFQKGSQVTREQLEYVIKSLGINHIPVVANLDFGHSTPLMTLPVGGNVVIKDKKITVKVG